MAPSDLVRNLAFMQHQDKLRGAIHRFAKTNPWRPFPRRVEESIQKTAFKQLTEDR